MVWTNIHKQKMFETWFEGSTAPTSFYFQLASSGAGDGAMTVDTSACTDHVFLSSHGGYNISGIACPRNGVSGLVVSAFGDATQTNNYVDAVVTQTLYWSSNGGIGTSGAAGSQDGAFCYLALTDSIDPTASGTVYAFWSLGGDTTVPDTQTLTITGGSLRGT